MCHKVQNRLIPDQERGPLIVGLGEILWDILPQGHRLGGAPANFVFQARSLGAEGYIVSRVGKDQLGEEILSQLKSLGLSPLGVTVDTVHPTGIVSVSLDDKGVPKFTIHENAAWDHLAMTPEILNLASRAEAVCFGSLAQRSKVSGKAIFNFIEKTKKDCLRILDINLRQPYYSEDIIAPLLNHSTILKLNLEEMVILAEMFGLESDETKILDSLLRQFSLKLIALTMGEKGSRLYATHGESYHPGFSVPVVDTVGAGDAFTAALVMGVLKGEPLAKINEEANRMASLVCTQSGAWTDKPKAS
jgi:fructokinase